MPWWSYLWILILISLQVGYIWNDFYEKHAGLATALGGICIILNGLFIVAYFHPAVAQWFGKSLMVMALATAAFVVWHGTLGLRRLKREDPALRGDLERETMVWIHWTGLVLQSLFFGPSIYLGIRAALPFYG